MNEQLKSIQSLTGEQWERARGKAETIIRDRLVKPDKRAFLNVDSKYPPAVRVLGVLLLVVVTVAAFMVSAGKQVVAADRLYQELAINSNRIVPGYVIAGIVALLLLAEFSVIAFGYGAKVSVSERTFQIFLGKGRKLTLSAGRILRGLQIASMTIAVGGNLTAFALTYTQAVWAFDLLLTLAAPMTVIGVGVMIENLVSEAIYNREKGLKLYRAALEKYSGTYAQPNTAPDWNTVWGQAIFDQLRSLKRNQFVIDAALEADPSLYQQLVSEEWKRHNRTFTPPEIPGNSQVLTKTSPNDDENYQDVPTSPKFNFAVLHLVEHPERLHWSGRDLMEKVPFSDGKPISYRTWNDAKPYAQARLTALLPAPQGQVSTNGNGEPK